MGIYAIYFISAGIVLVVTLSLIFNLRFSQMEMLEIIGYYLISYFIGYITPGAPGGIGIRETILILLLSLVVPVDYATMVALIHRVITIISDIVAYSVNWFYINKIYSKKQNTVS